MKLIWRAALVALGIVFASASAQAWPDKTIRAFIPFGAGSATDVLPRTVFDALSKELGQPITVENKGGAGGTLGIGEVVRAQPDGYTILANSSAQTIAPFIVPNFPYDIAKDLSGALMIGQNANVLLVMPSKGWKTVADFVAAAKAKPGAINFGSAGVGTATHISGERFRLAAGIEATHVPYKGGAEALTDLLGGRIDFLFTPISTALPLIHDGRVVPLMVSTPTRASDLPDVPTPVDLGYKDATTIVWYAVFMPSKTPRDIVEKFHAAAMKVLATPEMKAKLKKLAVDPMPMTPAEIDKFVVSDLANNGKLIKAAGIVAH
ncbi:MAG TPA: tripartite tricarboxylate transporter substrate-binding protein [Pseudolabrys sp.]|nr:tripartite tricarboxylate transporter substrate-binding protein [Pseudolabrys sp.]